MDSRAGEDPHQHKMTMKSVSLFAFATAMTLII